MGYRNQNGYVGSYRGADVHVIGYKDLTEAMTNDSDIIFAVRCNNNEKLELVQRGMFIGLMSDEGHMEIFEGARRRSYRCYNAPGLKKEEQTKTVEEKPAFSSGMELDASEGYGEYSTVVDNFFKGLEQLWAEIDAGIKV